MYTCICGKSYETKGAINGHKAKCPIYQRKLKEYIDKHYTKEFLKWWFYERKGSAFTLVNMFNKKYKDSDINLNTPKILNLCHEYGIKTWSIKEGNNLPHVRKKRHEFNNLAKGTPGYEKRQARLAEEGITNVFQRESVKQKIKQTMLEKYGVANVVYLDWYRSNNGQESKPHIKVMEYLESRGLVRDVDMFSEKNNLFNHFNDDIQKNFCPRPDIWIPSINTVIEVYGDRWHANPKFHKKDEIIHTWYGDISSKQIWDRDKIREEHMKKYFNVKVLILWEDDINKDKFKEYLDDNINEVYKD